MKRIKNRFFGYSKNEVSQICNSYEAIIETQQKNISYLQTELENEKRQNLKAKEK